MNYSKLYQDLIQRAKDRSLQDNVYYEKHHILPVSMGGKDDCNNIVSLTAKEHFVAHHLLWKIHRNREMTHAFMLMCSTKRGGVKYKVYARDYQLLKEDNKKFRSEFMSGRPGNNLGRTLPQEWKDNISNSLIGNKYAVGNSNFKGKKHSEESKKKISERMIGNANHSVPHSKETKQMMSENRKGKTKQPWSEERKAARRELLAQKKLNK